MSEAGKSSGGSKDGVAASTPRCPVCDRPRAAAFRPFCSERCRSVDLSRWLTGAYAIAGEPSDPDDDEA